MIACRLVEEMDGMVIGTPSGDAMSSIQLSVGICMPQDGETLDSLITRTASKMHRSPQENTHSAFSNRWKFGRT